LTKRITALSALTAHTALTALGLLGLLALLGLFGLTVACAPEFDRASILGDELQVIAIRSTPPEVRPGETVQLDALIHLPASDPDPNVLWFVCVPEVGDTLTSCVANNLMVNPMPGFCAADPAARLCIASTDATAMYTVPVDAFPDDGEEHTIFVTMMAMTGAEYAAECQEALLNGAPTEHCHIALKRIVVSEGDGLNVNPVLSRIYMNGQPADPTQPFTVPIAGADPGDVRLDLVASADATSIDEMTPIDEPPGPAQLWLTWYADCGELETDSVWLECEPATSTEDATCFHDEVVWQPQVTGLCTVHAVVRDLAGGIGFISQPFLIE
jgi:hypothetical protein